MADERAAVVIRAAELALLLLLPEGSGGKGGNHRPQNVAKDCRADIKIRHKRG